MSRKLPETVDAALVNNRFTLEIEANEAMLHDQVVTAIESHYGSKTWATIDVGTHVNGWLNYFTARFTVHEEVDPDLETEDADVTVVHGQTYELSIDKLKHGLALMYRKGYRHDFCDVIKGEINAEIADTLVQFALFGRLACNGIR